MLPNPRKITLKFKKPESGFPDSSFLGDEEPQLQQFVDISSSSPSSSNNGSLHSDDENTNSKAVVLYNPETGDSGAIVSVPGPDPGPLAPRRNPFRPSQPLPAVGAFTVQCAECFKWRLIPTKEKYEAIRERILERPFYCTTARDWRPDISCDEPADISQDGSRLWAIDKPNIAQPPPGWQRLLRIRGEGSTKFADVYYVAPSGKRLRSMVEIQKYLFEHPELTSEGLSLSQFSFRCPKPLQENYVRKRPRLLAPSDGIGNRPLETDAEQIQPLAWAGPDDSTDLQLGISVLPPTTICEPTQPAKRQATETSLATEQDILDKNHKIDPKIYTESS